MRQTLVFDADDTLWENNVLFERVIADYLDWLAHPTLDHAGPAGRARRRGAGQRRRARLRHAPASCAACSDCFERLNERPADAAEASGSPSWPRRWSTTTWS